MAERRRRPRTTAAPEAPRSWAFEARMELQLTVVAPRKEDAVQKMQDLGDALGALLAASAGPAFALHGGKITLGAKRALE